MATPTINDLPIATTVNDTDQMLIRQPTGALGVDKNATVSKVRQINISGLAALPITAQSSDLLMIEQGGTNYQIRCDALSFPKDTKMWFYHNVASDIPGWSIFSSGDTLLAVKGGGTYAIGGVNTQGNWLQSDHTLTLQEIPSHSHTIPPGKEKSGSHGPRYAKRAKDFDSNSTITSDLTGGGTGHNHGNTWRPLASVGIICKKN